MKTKVSSSNSDPQAKPAKAEKLPDRDLSLIITIAHILKKPIELWDQQERSLAAKAFDRWALALRLSTMKEAAPELFEGHAIKKVLQAYLKRVVDTATII